MEAVRDTNDIRELLRSNDIDVNEGGEVNVPQQKFSIESMSSVLAGKKS